MELREILDSGDAVRVAELLAEEPGLATDRMERMSTDAGEPCIEGTTDHVEFFMHGDGLLQAMAAEGNQLGATA